MVQREKRKIYRSRMKEVLQISLGTFLMALAVNMVYEPMGMVTGGVSGLAIIVAKISAAWPTGVVPVWFTNFALNIPIFIGAFFIKGKEYLIKTFYANLCFSLFLYVVPVVDFMGKDYMIAAVVGSVLNGAGLGVIFSRGCSTGGTDLLSAMIHRFVPYYPVGAILFVLDSGVILAGAFIFGVRAAGYAVISVYIASRVIDAIVDGGKFAKLAYVISKEHEEIEKAIMGGLDRGVTELEGKGAYTGIGRKVLLCVVDKKEIVELNRIVHKIDPKAFVIISDAREVFGEGFVKNDSCSMKNGTKI